jgi:hypothetical protein
MPAIKRLEGWKPATGIGPLILIVGRTLAISIIQVSSHDVLAFRRAL